MPNLTERNAINIVLMWRDSKLNRAAMAPATHRSITTRCAAIVKLLDTDNLVDEKTVEKILKSSTQYSYTHRLATTLISISKWAVENNLILRCPLHKIRLPRPNFAHRKYWLSREELDAIKNAPITGRLSILRDYFLLQCYTGLAYADVKRITIFDRYEAAGREWIKIVRAKTKSTAVVPISPEAKEILNRYNWTVSLPSNQKYNEDLKEIQRAVGIERQLHSHIACKTFVQLYLEKGLPVQATAQMRGITAKTLIEHYGTLNEHALSAGLKTLGL